MRCHAFDVVMDKDVVQLLDLVQSKLTTVTCHVQRRPSDAVIEVESQFSFRTPRHPKLHSPQPHREPYRSSSTARHPYTYVPQRS
jgi:hypothetical protein